MLRRPPRSTLFPTRRSSDLDTPLTAAEEAMVIELITRQREPSVIDALVALLKAGRSPRRILDAIQEGSRSEEHTSELQSLRHLVCRLLLEKKNNTRISAVKW